jgi:hypothetical protein
VARPVLTFDLDGVLCRPPFGINPGKNIGKPRKVEGHRTLLAITEPYRYYGRRPMPGAVRGFAAFAQDFDVHVVTARTERCRRVTEGWFRRWFGHVPALHLRADYSLTPAAFKLQRTAELGASAHFEDDPHTAAWLAEQLPAVLLVDWPRNRWLRSPRVYRIARILDAQPILQRLLALE